MSNSTTNFNLVKPEKTDPAAISVINGDLDIIDEEMHKPPLTVNGTLPDSTTRNLTINEVPLAGNLTSDEAQDIFGSFITRTSGGSASIADGTAWLVSVKGNSVKAGYVPEFLDYDVNSESIEVTFDEDTFRAYVANSGTYTLTYTTSWSADPALYGFTVTGTPANGDTIVITYTAENRGVITSANPSTFNSTGWNLYNYDAGYARVVKYSEQYGYVISGTYSILEFSTTVNGTRSTITPVNGAFNVPADGYVFVTGGNQTDTEIYLTWTDWTDPDNVPDFAVYSVDQISLAAIMVNFPSGLMAVGEVRDEINLNTQRAISRIERVAYTEANLAAAVASGLPYDTDTDYIYKVRETPETTAISVSGEYDVSDHGLEFFLGSSVACYTEILYGQDLKGKLRRDVLTISAQELTPTQQAQVKTNLGIAGADSGMFLYKEYSCTKTISAGQKATCSKDNFGFSIPTGYEPLAIYSLSGGASDKVSIGTADIRASGTTLVTVYNFSNSSTGSITIKLGVVFIKTGFMSAITE